MKNNDLILIVAVILMIFLSNIARAGTVYKKDANGNIIQRAECSQFRCDYFDQNGNFLGYEEKQGSTINKYDSNGNLISSTAATY